MNNEISLKEWDYILKYADKLCADLCNDGIPVRKQPYQVSDGRRGLYIQVLDSDGNFLYEYASGIDTMQHMIMNLDAVTSRIRKEYI